MTMPTLKPQRVLAIGAHSDDLAWWAGGTLAWWAKNGAIVKGLNLTQGDKGTSDPNLGTDELVAQREVEERTATKILGLTDVAFADFEDGFLADTRDVRREIVRHIREFKPDTIVGWAPDYFRCLDYGPNHPDHLAAGAATCAAIYPLARDHKTFPELELPTHTVEHLLLIQPHPATWETVWTCDITAQFDVKAQAVNAYTSQTGLGSRDQLHDYAAKVGKPHGLELAEAFVYSKLPR